MLEFVAGLSRSKLSTRLPEAFCSGFQIYFLPWSHLLGKNGNPIVENFHKAPSNGVVARRQIWQENLYNAWLQRGENGSMVVEHLERGFRTRESYSCDCAGEDRAMRGYNL